jgi:hypothetical protein
LTKTALLICVLVSATLFAATKPPRHWKTGTIEATAERRALAGSASQNHIGPYVPYVLQVTTGRLAYAMWLGYGIHTESMDYLVQYLLVKKNFFGKPVRPNVTVHGPIKFAVENGALYLLDEDGLEFETVIMEKRLPEPKLQQPPAASPK